MIVGTWNVENLFRPESDGGTDDAQVYEQKPAGLARTIEEIDVDVLAVEEVGDAEALEDLRRRLPGTWHAETSTFFDPRRTIRVGFLSRLVLRDVEQVHDFPPGLVPVQVGDNNQMATTMGRGALRVRVHSGGHDRRLPPEVKAAHLPGWEIQHDRRGPARALRRLRAQPAHRGSGHRAHVRELAARRQGQRAGR